MKLNPWLDESMAMNGKEVRQNFSAWFGKSKVVDEHGLPLQLYHGTRWTFDAFDGSHSDKNTKTGVPESTYVFSNSPEVASSYAGQKTPDVSYVLPTEELYDKWVELLKKNGPGGKTREFHDLHQVKNPITYAEGGQVMAVYLQVNKLFRINAKDENWRDINFKGDWFSSNDLMSYAKTNGYDGVLIRNVKDRQEGKGAAADTYAVFSASQIKSTLNNGLFLPNSASLTDFEASQNMERALRARSEIEVNAVIEKSRKRKTSATLTY